jgi:hypothetical protein
MKIKKEINKALTNIARQIHKRVNLPKAIKRHINAEPFAYKLCIKWYYAEDYVYTMELRPDQYTYFEEVSWLTAQLHDKIVKFASDKALRDLANQGSKND